MAKALGLSVETLSRLENARGRGFTHEELDTVAEVTGVPLVFLLEGFAATRSDERLERLEAQQAEDAVRLAQLEAAVRALDARGRRAGVAGGPER